MYSALRFGLILGKSSGSSSSDCMVLPHLHLARFCGWSAENGCRARSGIATMLHHIAVNCSKARGGKYGRKGKLGKKFFWVYGIHHGEHGGHWELKRGNHFPFLFPRDRECPPWFVFLTRNCKLLQARRRWSLEDYWATNANL